MATRNVQAIRKDTDGDITHLYNSVEFWSPRNKNDVITDIERDIHSYYVFIASKKVDILVIESPWGKYLRTDPCKTAMNKLDELPNF